MPPFQINDNFMIDKNNTLVITPEAYNNIFDINLIYDIVIHDHIRGFDNMLHNRILDQIHDKLEVNSKDIYSEFIFDQTIKSIYPKFNFKFAVELFLTNNSFDKFDQFRIKNNQLNFNNFICSFNGGPHVSRQFLTSALYKFGWFDAHYCSKNFAISKNIIVGNIGSFCDDQTTQFYRKFIIDDSHSAENFYNDTNGFNYTRFDHINNIKFLESRLTESFVHVVSETIATSYYPFITEKFLYSIVTNGLFVTYGQPNWHNHLETYFGFKKYEKIFDYRFDTIENPVIRLVELLTMLSKFAKLTAAEWHDLYLLEHDTIEYNYNHYYSGEYNKKLKNISNVTN